MTPFAIDGPAVISFSGGRTSAYMLRRILDDGIRPDVHVLFADTGKERDETYAFVNACAVYWQVDIHWVERPGQFTQLITDKRMLPNVVMRFCTSDLKVKPIEAWMRGHGYTHWTNVIGIRADEPRRITRMRERNIPEWETALPLADAGVTLADITAFWQRQPFDLDLQPHEGNCDLCFLKGLSKKRAILRERPDLGIWWMDQEARIGATFRHDQPSYAQMLAQTPLPFDDPSLEECFCVD